LSIIDERLTCPNFDAVLEVYAQAHVEASVNYGFTLITKLEWPIDLSDSYLYFRTRGEVTARFVVDAAVRAFFNTGNREIFAADKFGATFSIPGIVTIGPNFKLLGQLEGSALLGVKFQSLVKLAEWDIQQTYPVPNEDWEPEASRHPDKDNTQSLFAPEFEYGLTLSGHLTAHIKPTITFGIEWNQDFLPLDDCAVNVVADGHVTFHAEGKTGSSGTEFCYGVDAGADLYATIDAPSAFDWALPESPFPILPIDDVQIYPTDGKPACWSPGSDTSTRRKRSIGRGGIARDHTNATENDASLGTSVFHDSSIRALDKRDQVYGPLVTGLKDGLRCPGESLVDDELAPCPRCAERKSSRRSLVVRQSGDICPYEPNGPEEEDLCPLDDGTASAVERRGDGGKKSIKWPEAGGTNGKTVILWYPPCAKANTRPLVTKWYSADPTNCSPVVTRHAQKPGGNLQWVTEHIYEVNTLKMFFDFLTNSENLDLLPYGYGPATRQWVADVLINEAAQDFHTMRNGKSLIATMAEGLGTNTNLGAMVIADRGMNREKEVVFQLHKLNARAGDVPSGLSPQGVMDFTRYKHRNVRSILSSHSLPPLSCPTLTQAYSVRPCLAI
jgi:chitinase